MTLITLSVLLLQIAFGCSKSDNELNCEWIKNVDNPDCYPSEQKPIKVIK